MQKTDKNSLLLSVLILLQPILDICSYFAVKAGFTSVTTMLRLAIFGCLIIYAFLLSEKKKAYYIFAAIAGVYWLIHMAISARSGYQSVIADLNGFARTVQLPALTLAFITLFRRAQKYPFAMGKYFSINYFIIGGSIILSFLVNQPVYTYFPKIGVLGWFATGNAQSCIVSVLAIPALFYSYHRKSNVFFILTMLVAFSIMFFLGTQVALYSIFITGISFLAVMLWNREKRYVMAGALIVALLVTCIALPYSPCRKNANAEENSISRWEDYIDTGGIAVDTPSQQPETPTYVLQDTLLQPLEERFGYEKVLEIYGGEIDAYELIDNRQRKINFCRLAMAEQDIWALLFGCEDMDFCYNGDTFDPENDFPAIFFYYGIVGLGLYLAFLLYFVIILAKDIFKSLKKLPREKVFLGLTLALSMGVAQLSGNVLRRPNVSIFLSLMLAYVYHICKIQKEQTA